jgi:uncharacterized protein YecE (DUF72 family)
MPQLTFFDTDRPEQAGRLAPKLRALAAQGIYFGTSSWKYEGWLGSIYAPERYRVRGNFSRKKFETECLAEYAETFPVVGGDFSFYQFPSPDYWLRLFADSPRALRFGFKVPEEITVATWPTHARYGTRAGRTNESFLDVTHFERHFARLLEPYRDRVATLMFEFGTFPKSAFKTGADFSARLDQFLGALPTGYRYAVEIRNPEYLTPDYFTMLAAHNVAHVFNAWTRMPALGDQVSLPGAFTADFAVVRALLRRGRNYADAVERFQPYRETQEPDFAARDAMVTITKSARGERKDALVFVNNRLEGNAPSTIEAVVEKLVG